MRFIEIQQIIFFPHSKLVYVLISIFFITILLCVTITTNVLVISVVVRQCYLLHIIIIIIRVYYSYLLISNNYTFIKPTILNCKYFISSVARQGHNIRTATTTNCVKLSMCSCQGFCPYRRGMPCRVGGQDVNVHKGPADFYQLLKTTPTTTIHLVECWRVSSLSWSKRMNNFAE